MNQLSNILVGVQQKGQILPSRNPIHFRFCFTLFQSSSLVWLRLDFAPYRHSHQTNLIELIALMIVVILETKFDKTDPEFFISLQFNCLQLSTLQLSFGGILKFDLTNRHEFGFFEVRIILVTRFFTQKYLNTSGNHVETAHELNSFHMGSGFKL